MKTLNYIFKATFLLTAFIWISCEKEGDSYNISEETFFPSIEFEQDVVIEVGEEFTPGAVVKEGENVLDYSIAGSVDNTTPGVYTINYSAVNSDGYANSSSQTVVVYDPSIVATDVSGTFYDTNNPSRTGEVSLVEGTTNIFYATDVGFAGAFPLYFQMNGDVPTVVPQEFASGFGVESVEFSYDPAARTITVLILPQEFGYTFQYN